MLFDFSPLPGLRLAPDLVSPAEERALIDRILAEPLTPFQFQGYEGKRLTRSYGWHYDFAAGRLARIDPIPDWLGELRHRCAAFAGLAPDRLVQALLIRYDPGAGIGWHRDRPVFEEVIGVSLGAPATLDFRRRRGPRRFDRVAVPLLPRGAYLLSGEARHAWEHGIRPHAELRFSVTFRALARSTETDTIALGERRANT